MASKLDKLKAELVIDADALSDCLICQPQLYYDVTSEHVRAVADRDAKKLELDEVRAETDRDIRAHYAKSGDKITEAAIQQQIMLDRNVKTLTSEYLGTRDAADQWQALKEAFQQRSFMLRELVALHVSERHDIAQAAGAGQAPRRSAVDEIADSNRRATTPARQEFRVRRRAGS